MIKNKYPDYALVVFFKPDRPSRFLTFNKQIATSLLKADYVVIMKIPSFENIDIKMIINENKFYYYNKTTLEMIRKLQKKVVVTFSSKNMKEVYENIFIKDYL